MKIQITKDKAVDVSLPFGGQANDVVGIELGSDHPQGCPAVRLRREHDGVRVVSVGFVNPPPASGTWTLPAEFRAPAAALAVNEGTVRQVSVPEGSSAKPGSVTPVELADGRRSVSAYPTRSFRLDCEVPDEVVTSVVKSLPEGHSPTAVSVLHASVAAIAAFEPAKAEKGRPKASLLALFAGARALHQVGFKNGALSVFTTASDGCGAVKLAEIAAQALGVDVATAGELVTSGLVEPGPHYQRKIAGAIRQVGIARDYLMREGGTSVDEVALCGFSGCTSYVAAQVKETTGLTGVPASVFGSARLSRRVASGPYGSDPTAQHPFLAAYGAALAASGTDDPLHLNLLFPEEKLSSLPVRLRIIGPILSFIALVFVCGWWAFESATASLVSGEVESLRAERDGLMAEFTAAVTQREAMRDLGAHVREMEAFSAARHTYGSLLAHLAESVPADIQLLTMEVADPSLRIDSNPRLQTTAAPQVDAAGNPLPTAERTADRPSLRLTGVAPKEDKVVRLMDELAAADFGGELIVDRTSAKPEERSPVIHSFKQGRDDTPGYRRRSFRPTDLQAEDPTARYLSFDVEFRLKERRFK